MMMNRELFDNKTFDDRIFDLRLIIFAKLSNLK
jgi:hypothetical protein